MGCFPTTQTWTTIMLCLCCCCSIALIMPQGSSAALQERLPIAVESANSIIPYPEDPVMWIWAADLLHQGLFPKDSTATGSGAGFSIDIQANVTTVSTADCKLLPSNSTSKKKTAAAMPTMKFTLDQFKLSPNRLQRRKRVSVPIPVTCHDAFFFVSVHYGIAALGPSPSAIPRQISASANLPLTFAYCVPPISTPGYGALFFGVRPPSSSSYPYKLPSLTKVPMSLSPGYSLLLTAVQMSNTPTQKLILGNGGLSVALSSVATYTYLPKTPYDYIYSRITKVLSQRGISEYKFNMPTYPSSGCYSLKKADLLALPKMKLVFSGKYPLLLDASNYFRLARDSVYCIRIFESDEAVIGTDAQQDRLVEFDLERKTFGFSEPLSKFNTSCALKFPAS